MSSEGSTHVKRNSSGEVQELRLEVQLMLEPIQGSTMSAMRHMMAGLTRDNGRSGSGAEGRAADGRRRVGQYPLR